MKMARELKVWGMTLSARNLDNLPLRPDGRREVQCKAVVATRTKKEAMALFGVTANEMNNYGGETGHEPSLQIAMSQPNQVFACGIDDYDYNFVPITRQPWITRPRFKRAPYVAPIDPPEFTDEELEAIMERFSMANDPVGQSIVEKIKMMLNAVE
jgi:hypothetical protein